MERSKEGKEEGKEERKKESGERYCAHAANGRKERGVDISTKVSQTPVDALHHSRVFVLSERDT